MGKKHPAPRPWTVQLTALYRPDRNERIVRAYELALPILVAKRQPKNQEEDPSHEALSTHRPVRTRLQ